MYSLHQMATNAAACQTGQAGYAVTPAAIATMYTQYFAAAAATEYESHQAAAAAAATGTTCATGNLGTMNQNQAAEVKLNLVERKILEIKLHRQQRRDKYLRKAIEEGSLRRREEAWSKENRVCVSRDYDGQRIYRLIYPLSIMVPAHEKLFKTKKFF